MREAVIVSSVRTAVGKAPKGTLRATRPDDLAAVAIKEAVSRAKGLEPRQIEDVILGCAMPEGGTGNERRANRVAASGFAGGIVGDDDQSVLLVGPASHRASPLNGLWRDRRM